MGLLCIQFNFIKIYEQSKQAHLFTSKKVKQLVLLRVSSSKTKNVKILPVFTKFSQYRIWWTVEHGIRQEFPGRPKGSESMYYFPFYSWRRKSLEKCHTYLEQNIKIRQTLSILYCSQRSTKVKMDSAIKGTHARDFHSMFLNFFAFFSH